MHPNLEAVSKSDIEGLVPGVTILGSPVAGGQKVVVPIEVNGARLALKVLLLRTGEEAAQSASGEVTAPSFDEARERVRREVSILDSVTIPQLARTGPIVLAEGSMGGIPVLFYSEEWIDGVDLSRIRRDEGVLSPSRVIQLGLDVSKAIEWLWANLKVHRDIKPGNIMRRSDGTFVLLDLGFALDLRDRSLTVSGFAVGTPRYYSPEHLDLMKKRNMDFRSDLYCLGVTMYEMATGAHPYYRNGMTEKEVLDAVLRSSPVPPAVSMHAFPPDLSDVIMRLLEKAPHLRYRSCRKFQAALLSAQNNLSGGT